MDKIQIEGQKKIEGKIKISGSKNSSLPILAASLLSDKKSKDKKCTKVIRCFSDDKDIRILNSKYHLKKIFVKLKHSKS